MKETNFEQTLFTGHRLPARCFGITDLEKGILAIIETPEDGGVKLISTSAKDALTPQVVWCLALGKFSYPRKVTYYFHAEGGYVRQAKIFRKYAMDSGLFCSLREKAKRAPIDQLMGACEIYLWAETRNAAFVDELRKAGFKKALLSWDCKHHWPEMDSVWHGPDVAPELVRKIKESGFLAGAYMIATYHINNGPDGIATVYSMDRVKKDFAADYDKYGYQSVFFDTLACNCMEFKQQGFQQTKRENQEPRLELLRHAYDRGMIIGSECGADWAVPYATFFEGMLFGHPRTGGDGSWENRKYPSMMLEPAPGSGSYPSSMDEYHRIPFWELVYHDAVISTFHWSNATSKVPGYWEKKDLMNILHGSIPLFHAVDDTTPYPGSSWREIRDRALASYRKVGAWHEKIGYDEMVDHRFLTEDRTVQETRFSSGWAAMVNFGKNSHRTRDGKSLPPMSYHLYQWK